MARSTRLGTLVAILRQGFLPLFHHDRLETATNILHSLRDGGARAIEFTHRGDGAHEVFAGLEGHAREHARDLVLGAGSVADAPTAAMYVNLGASFIVSPTMNPDIAAICNRRKVAYLPGCATATEVATAEERGAEIVKIFPGAAAGGPDLVRSILGPSPWSRLMPTGGVQPTRASIGAWFEAGAACVGLGSALVPAHEVEAEDWQGVATRVREVAALVADCRGPLTEEWA